jgi:hypothetical protein
VGGGINGGMDDEDYAEEKAATPNAAAPAKPLDARAKAAAAKAAAEAPKTGSLQMRPGVHAGSEPGSSISIPTAPGSAATPATLPVGSGGIPKGESREAATLRGDAGAGSETEDAKLSEEWPQLAAADPAALTAVGLDSPSDAAPGAQLGAKNSSAGLLVAAAVGALCLVAVGGAFAARNVYGGRRRRPSPPQ